MAVVSESLKNGALMRHYSDAGMMIRQVETGIEYSDAVDAVPVRYTYEETETPIPPEAVPQADAVTYGDMASAYLDGVDKSK